MSRSLSMSHNPEIPPGREEHREMLKKAMEGEFVDFDETMELHLGLKIMLHNMRNLDRRLRALEEKG